MRDPIKDGLKALQYDFISRLIHQPGLLRKFAALLRKRPGVARLAHIVADRDSVKSVFQRQWSFTTTQAPNMRAGEFVIAMEAGDRQLEEREFLKSVLPTPDEFGQEAAAASRSMLAKLESRHAGTFDLVDDYMVHVAWQPLAKALTPAAAHAIAARRNNEPDLFEQLRAVGAQLIVGQISPRHVLEHAERCAAALIGRVDAAAPNFDARWVGALHGDSGAKRRNAVGLMWVGHPATVQAGALCVQELFSQPRHLKELASQVRAVVIDAGQDAFSNTEVRSTLKEHVLELLRLRPPFPLLVRNVPRDTWFALGPRVPPGDAPAGSGMTLLVAGALADVAGNHGSRYCPGRSMGLGDRMLMFGHAERACIAKDHVVEVLVSALIGLLSLPNLRWGHRFRRIEYDGPTIRHMPLRYGS